jgi:hypothetical protein
MTWIEWALVIAAVIFGACARALGVKAVPGPGARPVFFAAKAGTAPPC